MVLWSGNLQVQTSHWRCSCQEMNVVRKSYFRKWSVGKSLRLSLTQMPWPLAGRGQSGQSGESSYRPRLAGYACTCGLFATMSTYHTACPLSREIETSAESRHRLLPWQIQWKHQTYPTQQPTNQPSNQRTTRPTNQPTTRPTNQPTSQPASQPTNQPINQPTTRSRWAPDPPLLFALFSDL